MFTQEEEDQNCHKDVKVVNELVFDPLEKARLEQFAPCFVGNEGNQKEEDDNNFRVQKARNQRPMKTHFGFDDLKGLIDTSSLLMDFFVKLPKKSSKSNCGRIAEKLRTVVSRKCLDTSRLC